MTSEQQLIADYQILRQVDYMRLGEERREQFFESVYRLKQTLYMLYDKCECWAMGNDICPRCAVPTVCYLCRNCIRCKKSMFKQI